MIYNVILNSNLRASGTVANAGYYFDWSVFPDGKYKLTWVFVSGTCNMAAIAAIPMVEINLGQYRAFRIDPTNVQTATTNVVEVVVPNILATNAPVFLDHRPSSNTFSVRLMTNALAPVDFVDNAAAVLPAYVLTLSLELVG